MTGLEKMIFPSRKQTALCALLALGSAEALAASGWDCQHREASGKDWVCVSDKKKTAKPDEESHAESPAEGEVKPSAGVEKDPPTPGESPVNPGVAAQTALKKTKPAPDVPSAAPAAGSPAGNEAQTAAKPGWS